MRKVVKPDAETSEYRRYRFQLSAEFQQFYIQDEWASEDVKWTSQAGFDLVALAPGTISVGTNCDRVVPVELHISVAEPVVCFDDWKAIEYDEWYSHPRKGQV